jgi:hypothetical protein
MVSWFGGGAGGKCYYCTVLRTPRGHLFSGSQTRRGVLSYGHELDRPSHRRTESKDRGLEWSYTARSTQIDAVGGFNS